MKGGTMKLNTILKSIKTHLPPIIVILCIAVFFIYCRGRFQTTAPVLTPEDGYIDIRGVDFSSEVYHLVNNWNCYPGHLYYPEDFSDPGSVPEAVNSGPNLEYGSKRMVIQADPGTWLAICSFSVDFGTRVFVNGQEVRNIGYVSADPDEAVPMGRFMTIPLYSGETGEIEIIYQYSNFVHYQGGFVQSTHISTPENIDEYQRGIALYSILLGSGLIFMMFWFLLSASIQKSREFAVLAFCCLIIAVRNQFFFSEYLLGPGYNFFWEYRVIVLDTSLIPASGLYMIFAFFPKAVGKKTVYSFTGLYAILAALHWILDTKELVRLCHISYYCCVPFLVWSMFCLLRYLFRKYRPEGHGFKPDRMELITLGTLTLFIVMLIREGMSTGINSVVTRFGLMPLVMVICIMLLAIVINNRIQLQILALQQIRQKNQLLEQVNDMNRDFLRMVAHELRTPLTVISGYAQLARMQMEKSETSEKTPLRLKTIQSEANRLGEIVTRLMDYTYNNMREAELVRINVNELINSAVAVMSPVCAKNDNDLAFPNVCDQYIKGNFELLLQVLINLIDNASRHTKNGAITIEAVCSDMSADGPLHPGERDQEFVTFSVKDTGSGIPPETVPHIFEKGYTTGGGSGLGLAICTETVELHGGKLELACTGPEGTCFRFTIPVWKDR